MSIAELEQGRRLLRRHSGQAKREPESSDRCVEAIKLDSRPGLLSAGVTFLRGNDGFRERLAVSIINLLSSGL